MASPAMAPNSGRSNKEMFKSFFDYCQENGKTTNIPNFMVWDVKVNHSGFRHKYTEDEIFKVGLVSIYSRFFYKYSIHIVKWMSKGKIQRTSLSVNRKVGKGVGNFGHLGTSSADEIAFAYEKLENTIGRLVQQLKFLGQPVAKIRARVNAAVNEAYADV